MDDSNRFHVSKVRILNDFKTQHLLSNNNCLTIRKNFDDPHLSKLQALNELEISTVISKLPAKGNDSNMKVISKSLNSSSVPPNVPTMKVIIRPRQPVTKRSSEKTQNFVSVKHDPHTSSGESTVASNSVCKSNSDVSCLAENKEPCLEGRDPEIQAEKKPYDYFKEFLTDDFLEKILLGTNKNLDEFIDECSSSLHEKTNLTELKTFLGLLLHMGTIHLRRMVDYWRIDPLFNISCFPLHMTRNRFLIMLKSLQFFHHNFGYGLLVKYFNEVMKPMCNNRIITLHDPLFYCEGYLRETCSSSEKKCDNILHTATDSNGISLKCLLTAFEDPDLDPLIYFLQSLVPMGHHIYLSNYYTSIKLAKALLKVGVKVTGLLNKGRIHKRVLNVLETRNVYVCQSGPVIYKIDGNGYLLSTDNTGLLSFDERMTKLVRKYKQYMGNKNDYVRNIMLFYTCRDRPMTIDKKIGIHILQLMLMNAYYLHVEKERDNKETLYDFRLSVIRTLLQDTELDYTRVKTAVHVPEELSSDIEGGMEHKCIVCYHSGKRKESSYRCPSCPQKPCLCLGKCFLIYHQLSSLYQ